LLSARNTDQHLLQFERIGSNLAFISLPDSSWIAARFCNSSISVIFCAIILEKRAHHRVERLLARGSTMPLATAQS